MITVLAILCAIVASLAFNYAMYMQKKAVTDLPEVGLKFSWATVVAFITNKRWVASMFVMLVGSVLYVVALTAAPVSIVQPIMASGVALLAYLAVKNLGEKPRRIDITAIAMSIFGVVLLGVSLAQGLPKDVKHSPVALWVFTAAMVAVAVAIPLLARKGSPGRKAAALGITVGVLNGTSAVFAKLLLVDWGNQWAHKGILVLFSSVFLLAWALTIIPAFIVLQAALQQGMAIVVVPVLSGLAQLVPIAMGMIALHESLPTSPALSVVRIAGFALILVATVILSRRAEAVGPEPVTRQVAGVPAAEPGRSIALDGAGEAAGAETQEGA